MRLIDADAIPYTMLYKENWMTRKGIEKQGAWKDDIDGMPTIEERKKGKWMPRYDAEDYPLGCRCSVCNETYVMPDGWANFCPNCGADMRGEEDEQIR